MNYYLLQDNITLVQTHDTIYDALLLSEQEYYDILNGISFAQYYWDGSQWQIRPTWTHDSPITIDETQSVTFTLPTDYTELRINRTPTTNTTWTPPGSGTYKVLVEPFPYYPLEIEIIVNENLDKVKERKIASLDKSCNEYILKHYQYSRQNTFKAKYVQIVDELTNNSSSYTTDQITNLETAKNRLNEVLQWIETVLDYYYSKLDEIKNATDIDTVNTITWDFSQFDSTDPQVTIEEIRSYLIDILWG